MMIHTFVLFSQDGNKSFDSLAVKQDSVRKDTLLTNMRKPSAHAVDKQVTYKATEFIKRDIANKRVILVKEAVVDYGDLEIKADSIVFDMTTNLLFAIGRKDRVAGSAYPYSAGDL